MATERPDPQRRPILRTRGLTKVYRTGEGEVAALRGVDLKLRDGELLVVLGHPGSGKSTLLNILGGLDVPTAGDVWFGDVLLSGFGDRALTANRRDHVGFLFQFCNLMSSLTARENVALASEGAPKPMSPDAALALVDLADRMDHFPARLSGGEQQRVAIARTIARQPDLLLCDEPTGALEGAAGAPVLAAIERLHRETGMTTVVMSRNPVVGSVADRIVRFADGKIVETLTNHAGHLAPGKRKLL
jgi:putative ABC transport system ATP-binding protein